MALFDPQHFTERDATGATAIVKVVNILGFFVEGTCGSGIVLTADTEEACGDIPPSDESLVGRLVVIPGLNVGGAGTVGPASFTKVIRLIR